jgi:UDP-N-acetyl-D-mannosaminuronate dehydrogenase
LENALLHVPVMFAYQLAYALPGHNVAEALRLAGTHWRLTPLYLGFGTGGRCVPLGTEYLVAASGQRLELGLKALDWDARFRELIADIVEKTAPRKVLVLGMAYRPEFRDMGLSPGLAVARALKRKMISVDVHDPMWKPDELAALTELDVPSLTTVRDYDVVLVATGHKSYLELPTNPRLWRRGQIVLDGPGAWTSYRGKFDDRGVCYKAVGDPGWMMPTSLP